MLAWRVGIRLFFLFWLKILGLPLLVELLQLYFEFLEPLGLFILLDNFYLVLIVSSIWRVSFDACMILLLILTLPPLILRIYPFIVGISNLMLKIGDLST